MAYFRKCDFECRGALVSLVLVLLLADPGGLFGQTPPSPRITNEIHIAEIEGKVECFLLNSTNWSQAERKQLLHPSDRLRTGANSRVTLYWSDRSVVSFGASTELEILPPDAPHHDSGLSFVRGVMSFFHRGEPGHIRITTRGTVAGIDGTEFVLAVELTNNLEQATLSVIDGKVRFGNQVSTLTLTNDEQAVVVSGQAPLRTAGFVANNLLQWCFYYPAVLDPDDLPFETTEQKILGESLDAYKQGDLLQALAKFPEGIGSSEAIRVYHDALLLSVGQVDRPKADLENCIGTSSSERIRKLASALEEQIAAVQFRSNFLVSSPTLATEYLAKSYYQQSRTNPKSSLKDALESARKAIQLSPSFGFAWIRLAELEFSFGDADKAFVALGKGLALSPRNAQGLALKGFILASQNRIEDAISWFDRALSVDSALGNAWLGRGLCRIRQGDAKGGNEDLLVAAAIEPRRASLRNYLGKSFAEKMDFTRAEKEFRLAGKLDPADPTTPLYSALINQQRNRVNEAIYDLEKSEALNENRSVYRSQLLLDQDQAVRSASLANIYRDAGMTEVSLREASRAVIYDYGNYSAHLFLADSYNQLRDPNDVNLRYESPAENEYLIANLLAPVGAGTLSQSISQQEYSKLFEKDRVGAVSETEYLSRGAWAERGAVFGISGNSSFALESFSYRTDPGQRPNNDIETRDIRFHFKQQVTPQDTLYLRVIDFNESAGNVLEYRTPPLSIQDIRSKENQQPIVNFGYNHEWSPGVHTLFLASRLADTYSVTNPNQETLFSTFQSVGTPPFAAAPVYVGENYHSTTEIYSTELQQIWDQTDHTTVLGARYQAGNLHTKTLQTDQQNFPFEHDYVANFFDPSQPVLSQQDIKVRFERVSLYGYQSWQIDTALQLVGGMAYDAIKYPDNFRAAPISDQVDTAKQVSPKAGFIWTPTTSTTFRFGFARAITGAGIDQDYLLEPSQVAGFNQSYRSIIPETITGAEAGAKLEMFNLALEHKTKSGTYLGLSGKILNSHVNSTLGVFGTDFNNFTSNPQLYQTPTPLDYTERSFLFYINQLLGKELAMGASYELIQANIRNSYPGFPTDYIPDISSFPDYEGFLTSQSLNAVLHHVALQAVFNSSCGFFSKLNASWYQQDSAGYTPSLPTDAFWHLDMFAGYRFPGRRAELQLGLLNLTAQSYQLNPLTLYNELPQTRTFTARFKLTF